MSQLRPPRRGLRAPTVLTTRVGGLPRAFWWLWAGSLVNRAGTFVVPFLALYVTRGRGFGDGIAGAVLLAFGLGLLPSQPVGGMLADRVGRIPTMLGATMGSAAAMLALAVADTPGQLMAAAFALGLFGESYRPAASALIADLVPVADRPRAFGLQFWAVNLGFAVSASLGGLLAARSYSLLFVGDAVTTVTFGLLVAWRVREPVRAVAVGPQGLMASLRVVVTDRLFLAILGLNVLYALMYAQVQAALSLDVVSSGLTEADYGTVLALNGVVIVLVQPLVIGRVSRWRPGVALAGGAAVLGLGLGATTFADTWTAFAVTVTVWTLGEIVVATFSAPTVADISPADMRGRYQGWWGLSFSVAFAVGPALGLAVFGRWGGGVLWGACAVVGLLTAMGWLRLRHGIAARRDMASAAAVRAP